MKQKNKRSILEQWAFVTPQQAVVGEKLPTGIGTHLLEAMRDYPPSEEQNVIVAVDGNRRIKEILSGHEARVGSDTEPESTTSGTEPA